MVIVQVYRNEKSMADYEALMAKADRLRMERNQPAAAIELYQQALDIGGPSDRHLKQMIGVCYQMLHHYQVAIQWYWEALSDAENDVASGNVLRDLAEAHSATGNFSQALDCLRSSLGKLSYEGNRHTELYNKLHFANCLSLNRQPVKARLIALRALKLALKYGAGSHRMRAVALIVGGHQLDEHLRQRRRQQQ
jgi:tetratricopeptide (TPR) repeat protein